MIKKTLFKNRLTSDTVYLCSIPLLAFQAKVTQILGYIAFRVLETTHLKRSPSEELQSDERIEQFWQTETNVSILIGRVVFWTPCFKLCFNAVNWIETLKDIFKNFAGFFQNAI